MHIINPLDELPSLFKGFPYCRQFNPLSKNILVTAHPLVNQQICLKKCAITNPDLFNGLFHDINNNPLVYQLLPYNSGGFIYKNNDYYLYAYNKVIGDTFTFTREKALNLGRALACLHNLLNKNDLPRNSFALDNMIERFLSRRVNSLSNGTYRVKYVLEYLNKNPNVKYKAQYLIHGDVWAKNIITNTHGITFIDFDSIRVFYTDYELMRCFFISLIDSIITEVVPVNNYIHNLKGYFKSYVQICGLNLLSAFEFYLFIFCLECDVEDMALHDTRMQVFLYKRNLLQLVLIKNINNILSVFTRLMEE
ncbi:hypothetical protein [Dickeya zeae]|uniref:hypothetical protein n=1 Tax=Dickeya zeae TaxID=204042 RepID=UPI001F180AB4|nr:hypothetical protein [Dickeya zeae]UJR64371.1 hypothetical protein HJ586_20430 [Dickeya zeae]